ncbi:MAG: tRNA (N6-threonylcarbamoyladenosine(37)-N6)-methyltransferase TrmO [Desulfobacterales bacterium]|nr:tRNA (N6-threonylcarbamoyladenosine(37)-N6)-methyltransferase TrmO [Desulfobacterales bacterium]
MNDRFSPIGVIHSCFKEKFGIPRQPGLAVEATATLELFAPYDCMEALRGLEAVSHIWVLFVFHANGQKRWSPTVRPPRLGGNRRIGVFATRSGFRPNPIGMSAVRLTGFDRQNGTTRLHLKGVDLLDGTPVLDIKPYLPYADAIFSAETGFAKNRPEPTLEVVFLPPARTVCLEKSKAWGMDIETLIVEVLAGDPRPAYTTGSDGSRNFGIRLLDFDLRWRVEDHTAVVTALVPITD